MMENLLEFKLADAELEHVSGGTGDTNRKVNCPVCNFAGSYQNFDELFSHLLWHWNELINAGIIPKDDDNALYYYAKQLWDESISC